MPEKYKYYRLEISPTANDAKRPRHWRIEVEFDEPVLLKAWNFDLKHTEFRYITAPPSQVRSAYLTHYYKKENGCDALLSRLPINDFKLQGLIPAQLKRYDHCFFIDSSRVVEHEGSEIFFAGIIRAIFKDVEGVIYAEKRACGLEIWNPSGPAEKVGWLALLDYFANDTWKSNMSTAIVTDHDLGSHSAFNMRERPFLDKYFLPPNASLLYARDKGGEPINKTLRDCDWIGDRLLDHVIAGGPTPNELKNANEAPFTHYRLWNERFLQEMGWCE
jgi:hypothetical protein